MIVWLEILCPIPYPVKGWDVPVVQLDVSFIEWCYCILYNGLQWNPELCPEFVEFQSEILWIPGPLHSLFLVQGLHARGSVKRPHLAMTYTHLLELWQRLHDCRRLKQTNFKVALLITHEHCMHTCILTTICSSFHFQSCATTQQSYKTENNPGNC